MPSRLRPLSVAAAVLALLAGGAALGYAWWGAPLVEAERALAAGQSEAALDAYRRAERRFGGFDLSRRLFAQEHGAAVANQLALLYRAGAYDAVVAQAAAAPAGAAPQFWAGTALMARALGEKDPRTQLVWLTRAEAELKQALSLAPDDWDTRFNYEVAARLAASLRRPPSTKDGTRLQLLRPQPPQQQTPRRVG